MSELRAAPSDPQPGASGWPPDVWHAPLFRLLDERGRRELEAAGRRRSLVAGESLFSADAAADSFFIVTEGSLTLDAGGGDARVLRRGQMLGEEAFLHRARAASARARDAAVVVELPVRLFERVMQRAGGDAALQRARRALSRAVASERLGRLALARHVSVSDFERLLDAAAVREGARGEPLCAAGERADALIVVMDGLLQIERERDGRVTVAAYLAPGDVYGLDAVLAGGRYAESAVALGRCSVVCIAAAVVRDVAERAPAAMAALRAACEQRLERQRATHVQLPSAITQHAFDGMERLELARSLLVIDPESCVQCGHCAWACAQTHGVARLERRGEFVRTQLVSEGSERARLFLPNACQHCVRPECLAACPTGAISVGSTGAVLIRESLCTGCGACAKACPWDSIWMTRAGGPAATLPASEREVAIKCDLCNDYAGPACVQACPTEAIRRVEPRSAFAEVGAVLGRPVPPRERALPTSARAQPLRLALPAALLAIAGAWSVARARGITADGSAGVLLGWFAALLCVVALGYVLPKRAVRRWQHPASPRFWRALRAWSLRWARRDGSRAEVRSVVKPWLSLHLLAGTLASVAAAAHGGLRFRADWAGALEASFWLTIGTGVWLKVLYDRAPRVLSRVERRGGLPEDLAGDGGRLFEELERRLSGRDELLKRIAERWLVPYARSWSGPWLLACSGRTLSEEQAALRERVTTRLAGRGGERLQGLDEAIRVVVELRALPLRRALYFALRAGLPVHIVCTALCVALLAVHVVSVWRMY